MATSTLSLHSSLQKDEKEQLYIELKLVSAELPELKSDELLVRVEASPINPSDIMRFLPSTDLSTIRTVKDPKTGHPITRINTTGISNIAFEPLPSNYVATPGNEGAGHVIKTGDSKEAQHFLDKKVAILPFGNTWTQYRIIKITQALELLPGTSSVEGGACFVNPYTVLGFLGTLKEEGYKGIVHTAAASALGQQLVKICKDEKIPLVNIVRREEQVELLKKLGAEHVINSSSPTFVKDLENAIVATDAYLAFDAVGGGTLGSQILTAMEGASKRKSGSSDPFANRQKKQLYIYGMLDQSPTILSRSFGINWSIGVWTVFSWLQKLKPQELADVRTKIAKEIKTTFATSYDKEISLTEALEADIIRGYAGVKTGGKYVLNPSKSIE